jgi:hypothetical protein
VTVDHKDQHHQQHRHEREEKIKEHKQHEAEALKNAPPLHPAWAFTAGIVLAVVAMLVWTFIVW